MSVSILSLATCLIPLLFQLLHCHGEETVVYVCSESGLLPTNTSGCDSNIDQALRLLSSNTQLLLSPGQHVLEEFTLHRALENISLVGMGTVSNVVLTCSEGVGLAFFGVHNLRIQNLTIEGCGTSGLLNWAPILKAINQTFGHTRINFPSTGVVKVGLFLGDCADITLDGVSVTKTSGIGLLSINVVGSNSLTNVSFLLNTPPKCDPTSFLGVEFLEWVGGGAYFLYEDYSSNHMPPTTTLSISSAEFAWNKDCGVVGYTELYLRLSTVLQETGYYIGAGGGLSVMLTQVTFPVGVEIESTVIRSNQAKFGGGLHLGFFKDVTDCYVSIKESFFIGNGDVEETYAGGGFVAIVDIFSPHQLTSGPSCANNIPKNLSIVVVDTNFTQNTAFGGGGGAIYSHCGEDSTLRVSFLRCNFEQNVSPESPAVGLIEFKYSSLSLGLQAEFCDCTFASNIVKESDNFGAIEFTTSGTVGLYAISLRICGNSNFIDNIGTALAGVRSSAVVQGDALFARNRGAHGGGLILSDYSFLIMKRNSSLKFINNSATIAGGAIYAQLIKDTFAFMYDDCFLYFEQINLIVCATGICSGEDLNVSITFSGNTALSGSTVYGSTLETCPWGQALRASDPTHSGNVSFWEYLYERWTSIFSFDQVPVGSDQISTQTDKLVISGDVTTDVMPGQRFTVQVEALDKLGQPVTEGITSEVSKRQGEVDANSKLGASGYWFLDGSSATVDAPVIVTGSKNQSVDVKLLSIDSPATIEFNIVLVECLAGFVYYQANRSCVCEEKLTRKNVKCDIDQQSLTVPDNTWVGPIESIDPGDGVNEYLNSKVVVHDCILDYCEPGEREISIANYNQQCAHHYHRAGLLCGECEEGYSVQLGSSQCGKCSHYYLFLLVFFIVSGVLLVFAMIHLRITITEGYLNGVLFYSNVVNLFAFEFTPSTSGSGPLVITSFLSLNFGLESCFYDGMDALARSGLQLVFVAYLYFLMGAITLIARYVELPGTKNYSPMKVFATMIVLSYVSVLQTCCEILAPVTVETLDGSSELRWYINPTVHYFVGLHGFLGIVAIVLTLFYIIPLPVLGLFPRRMYSLKQARHFKPFYDALWAPFESTFRFWLGLRLILRWFPFGFAYFLLVPHKLFALGFFLVVLLYVQSKIRPFQGFWRNLVDDLLVANAILLVLGTLYFEANSDEGECNDRQTIYSSVIVAFAYLVFIGVFLNHIFLRFPELRKAVVQFPVTVRKKVLQKPNANSQELEQINAPGVTVISADGHSGDEGTPAVVLSPPSNTEPPSNFRHQPISGSWSGRCTVTFTELREPLLEDLGETSTVTSLLRAD